MKISQFTSPPRKIYFLLVLILFARLTMGQSEFSEKIMSLSSQNDTRLKKNFKAYKYYELSLKDIKTLIRNKKSDKSKPIQFTLQLDNDKIAFNLFENDIFADSYCEIENGVKKTKDQVEINTYAGFVGDDYQNALRIFISEDRISGFFVYNGIQYVTRNLSDYGVAEKKKPNKVEVVTFKFDDEILSLEGSFCNNSNIKKNARVAAPPNYPGYTVSCSDQINFPLCKYIKIKVASDQHFRTDLSLAGRQNVIIDYINQIDFVMSRELDIRVKLESVRCDYIFSTSNSSNIGTTLVDYSSSSVRQQVFGNPDANCVEYYLSGLPFGFQLTTPKNTVGQSSNFYSLGRLPNSSAISTINLFSGGPLSYSESYLVMTHEVGHLIGALHPADLGGVGIQCNGQTLSCSTVTVMCDLPNKVATFNTYNKKEIQKFLTTYPNALFTTSAQTFSNALVTKLNGNDISSTPVFINQSPKIIQINRPPYRLNSNSTYSSSDSRVFFYYKNQYDPVNYTSSSRFEIRTAPSFTLTVNASDQCNTYFRSIPFVYSPSGARLSVLAYPNPANDEILISNDSVENDNETIEFTKIEIYDKDGNISNRIEAENMQKKIKISTLNLKSGLYYLKVSDSNGNVSSKQIIINH